VAEIIPAISGGGFEATPVGLIPPKSKVRFSSWEEVGGRLRLYQGAIQWAIGDWLNYGDAAFGQMAAQAWNIWPEYSYDSLRKFARVARFIPLEERRPNISWSLHSEVAGLPKIEREKWLDNLSNGATRADMRMQLNPPHEKETCPTCSSTEVSQ